MRIQPTNATNYPQINFTARAVQVRDAQWVSHVINSKLPHFSTTKFIPIFANYLQKFSALLDIDKQPRSISEIQKKLLKLPLIVSKYKNSPDVKKDFMLKNKDIKLLYGIKNITSRVYDARLVCKDYIDLTDLNDAYGYLYQIKELHCGNCFENAVLAELILKLNGINNACTTELREYDADKPCARFKIDHVVCAFNDDGSKVDKVSKKTILIDPWLGKADYAENMKLFYKSIGNKYFGLHLENPTIAFSTPKEEIKIKDKERLEILALYPELEFKSKTRNFMQRKTP